MKKIAQVLDIAIAGKIRIHRNLSYEAYFSEYSRENDGRVILSTYSFNAYAFGSFEKLMPFSILQIAKNKEEAATKFVKRFPLYVVYLVPELHVKACWFARSRKMLIGSENLYGGTADYEELSCEFEVPASNMKEAVKLAFDNDKREYLRAQYTADDVHIYDDGYHGVSGKAYLPCHRETEYWKRISSNDKVREVGPHYIYCILEYQLEEQVCYLAFDRHYQFCGELAPNAFQLLKNSFRVRRQNFSFLEPGQSLLPSSPLKDYFAKFHPIACQHKARYAHYLDYDT
nr:hypothetical protein [uncultured Duganella sp.]